MIEQCNKNTETSFNDGEVYTKQPMDDSSKRLRFSRRSAIGKKY